MPSTSVCLDVLILHVNRNKPSYIAELYAEYAESIGCNYNLKFVHLSFIAHAK